MFNKLKKYFNEEERENRRNKKMKEEIRKRKVAESIYEDVITEYEDLKNKYIKLLEEKGEKFDSLAEIYETYKAQSTQLKDYKKELTDLRNEVRDYEKQLEEEREKSLSYEEELEKLKKKNKKKAPQDEIEKGVEEILNREVEVE